MTLFFLKVGAVTMVRVIRMVRRVRMVKVAMVVRVVMVVQVVMVVREAKLAMVVPSHGQWSCLKLNFTQRSQFDIRIKGFTQVSQDPTGGRTHQSGGKKRFRNLDPS